MSHMLFSRRVAAQGATSNLEKAIVVLRTPFFVHKIIASVDESQDVSISRLNRRTQIHWSGTEYSVLCTNSASTARASYTSQATCRITKVYSYSPTSTAEHCNAQNLCKSWFWDSVALVLYVSSQSWRSTNPSHLRSDYGVDANLEIF